MGARYISYISFSLLVIIGLTIPVILVLITQVDSSIFIRDVFYVVRVPPYIGFLSNIGAFMWCSTLGAIIITIITINKNISNITMIFLYYSAIINGWLLFDDFFMIHDYWLFLLNIPELYSHIGLGVSILFFVFLFFNIIRNTNYYLFLLALGFLGLSLAVDATTDYGFIKEKGRWYHLFEDGPKWIGACFWAAYFFSTMRRLLADDIANRNIMV